MKTIVRTFFGRLRKSDDGVSIIEFAFVFPVLAVFGLGGMELAQYTRTHMILSQVAVAAADNASRAKEEVVGGSPRFSEGDVEQIFAAVRRQSRNINLEEEGLLVLSSIQRNDDGGQTIKWQRCFGEGDFTPSFGLQGANATGDDVTEIGDAGHAVSAEASEAIMMVEVFMPYDPMLGVSAFNDFIGDDTIRYVSNALVRDDRDLTQIFPTSGVTAATCP